jgi:hypothetical protein
MFMQSSNVGSFRCGTGYALSNYLSEHLHHKAHLAFTGQNVVTKASPLGNVSETLPPYSAQSSAAKTSQCNLGFTLHTVALLKTKGTS